MPVQTSLDRAARSAELDRLVELVNIGAGHAASAFARLTDRPIWMGVPEVLPGDAPGPARGDGDRPGRGDGRGADWSTGVFFEFEGCVDAIVGILFHTAASEAVVRRVVGMEEGELAPHVIESALMEIGNILASHVASAIADTVGERLLPSIPTLAMDRAEQELRRFVALRGGERRIRIESTLSDASGALSGLLVMWPAIADRDARRSTGAATPA